MRVDGSGIVGQTALERAEDLAERVGAEPTARRRMLVTLNPYATAVSDRLRKLVVSALGARYGDFLGVRAESSTECGPERSGWWADGPVQPPWARRAQPLGVTR